MKKPVSSPRGAVFMRSYGQKETLLPALNTKAWGYVVLMKAGLHPLNPNTVIAYYGRPKL